MMRAPCPCSPAGQCICHTSHMTAGSAQHEAGWFTSPQQVNQRRYEALRAYFLDGLSYAEAGARFGYTRWAMINLVREHPSRETGAVRPAPQARPGSRHRAGQRPGPGPGHRAAAAGAVHL
jgi:hypothetical protein